MTTYNEFLVRICLFAAPPKVVDDVLKPMAQAGLTFHLCSLGCKDKTVIKTNHKLDYHGKSVCNENYTYRMDPFGQILGNMPHVQAVLHPKVFVLSFV